MDQAISATFPSISPGAQLQVTVLGYSALQADRYVLLCKCPSLGSPDPALQKLPPHLAFLLSAWADLSPVPPQQSSLYHSG